MHVIALFLAQISDGAITYADAKSMSRKEIISSFIFYEEVNKSEKGVSLTHLRGVINERLRDTI